MTEITIAGLKKKRHVGSDEVEAKKALANVNIKTGEILTIEIFEPSLWAWLRERFLAIVLTLIYIGGGWILALLFGGC